MTTMQIDRVVVEQALEALEFANVNHWWGSLTIEKAITAVRAALAQQAEPVEPVAWLAPDGSVRETPAAKSFRELVWGPDNFKPLYAAPPQLLAQRDALLKALKGMRHKYGEYACSVCDHADAAIKAVEETK